MRSRRTLTLAPEGRESSGAPLLARSGRQSDRHRGGTGVGPCRADLLAARRRVVVPMDGFHLADVERRGAGSSTSKGAP